MNKKQRLAVIICIIIFAIGLLVFLLLDSKKGDLSTEYTGNESNEYIVYGDKTYKYNEHLSNYLIMGIDTRDPVETYQGQSDAGQSDAMFLVSYDRVKKTISCLAIPRDTMTNVHIVSRSGEDLGTSRAHITTQYAYGDGKHTSCRLATKVVSETLYGIPIRGYCSVNMDGIPVAVGEVGEVEVVVPNNSLEYIDPTFKEGATVKITKDNAERYVRTRNTNVTFSAMDRLERQKSFMKAFGEKAQTKAEEDVEFVTSMYTTLEPYMVTNMGTDVFAKLAEASADFSKEIQNIPGEKVDGRDFDEYNINETQLYELILDMFYEEVQDK